MSLKEKLTRFVEKTCELNHHEYSVEHIQLGSEEFMDPVIINPTLKDKTLDTYTYYCEELEDIYSFIAYYKDRLVNVGYVKGDECYSIYLNNLEETLHDELFLIGMKEEDVLYASLDVD